MYFVGIDLAWSERNGSGVAILRGDEGKAVLCSASILSSDQEIVEHIDGEIKGDAAFIAIDSPLIVPNEQGRRRAEALVGILFGRYDAGAYPANRERLCQWNGKVRGEEISKLLEKIGYEHNPYIKKFEAGRKFFEVYPHPAMVVLFDLEKIIRYKARRGRDYEFRWREFKRYQGYLENLEHSRPPLILPGEILERDVTRLRGRALKEYEDLLDAIFCAYIAYYSWANPERCRVLGNLREGYILTPVSEPMREMGSEGKTR